MEESNGSPLQLIFRLLPLFMIGLLIMGMVIFAVTSVVPRWREFQAVQDDLEIARQTLAEQIAAGSDDTLTILEAQIESVQNRLPDTATTFMTAEQAEGLLDHLYGYARASGVQITSLQAQQSSLPTNSTANSSNRQTGRQTNAAQAANAAMIASTFRVQAFRLRVDGNVVGLMGFMARFREASIPGIVVTNVDLRSGVIQGTMLMDTLIYSSPFATGETYMNLPEITLPPQLMVPISIPETNANAEVPSATLDTIPPSLPSLPPDPPTSLLFSDSFDGGDLIHWNLGAGWYLAGSEGGQTLEVKDSHSDLTLAYNTLKDAAVQARVWLDTGGIRISLRQSAAGRYSATLDSLGLIALYRGEKLIQTGFSTTSGVSRWRTLRLSAIQGVIRVSVDGVEILCVADDSELPPGTVSFAITGRGTARVDDIEVWVLDSEAEANPA